jgi:hypothetical protein
MRRPIVLAIGALLAAVTFTIHVEGAEAAPDDVATTAVVELPDHTPGQSTIDVCRYIEALRFGLNPNGIQYRNCWEVHWWGQHQVVVRYISASTGNYFCVAYDRRGYDPDGEAFGFNDGCPYIGSVGFDSF